MNIIDIYKQYKIMPILALHQLRVAGVAFEICDSLSVKIDKESVIKACLLHDMGNIVKFNLNYFPEYNEPEGLKYWQKVQDDFITKYGNSDHEANIAIAKELNLSLNIINLIDSVNPDLIEQNRINDDISKKICIYCDNRVTPHKIVSIHERNDEVRKRYENHPHSFDEESRVWFMNNVEDIEKQIFSYSKIKPEDINNESIEKIIENLKNFEI